jgi:hypothetical protein
MDRKPGFYDGYSAERADKFGQNAQRTCDKQQFRLWWRQHLVDFPSLALI